MRFGLTPRLQPNNIHHWSKHPRDKIFILFVPARTDFHNPSKVERGAGGTGSIQRQPPASNWKVGHPSQLFPEQRRRHIRFVEVKHCEDRLKILLEAWA
eukprot:903098-Pelagomonas_calceolata.AAC.1